MKPEPLTKEKLKRCIELMAVIQEEVGEAQKELNNIWFGKPEGNMEKFKEEVKQIVSPLFELLQLLGYSFELKERVQWFLKEIEKIQNTIECPDAYGEGLFDGLTIAKQKIKKAFSRVIEE